VAGSVFTKLTDANIDLDLRAESILISRANDSLTGAGPTPNLKVAGPVMSATVKGKPSALDQQSFP